MANLTHRALVVDVSDINPTSEQLLAAVQNKTSVQFAYTISRFAAGNLNIGMRGIIEVEIRRLKMTIPGTFHVIGECYPQAGKNSIKVDGWYFVKPVNGFLDLTRS
jgi:hypothetical protein